MMRAIIMLSMMLMIAPPASAYIEVAHTLGRVVNEASNIVVLRVEKVDKERNLVIYRKVQDLKGKHPTDMIRHNIGKAGFEPREWQFTMAALEVGKTAIMFHNNNASETCIDNYWYQAYPGGEWWNMSHGEPYLLRTYAGKAQRLIPLVQAVLAGQEVAVPCMADGEKESLKSRTARIQRLRASLRIMDYNQKRDFMGWGGNEEFRRISNMPGFMLAGTLPRTDPRAHGIAAADFDGDGLEDLCLYGEEKVALLKSAGNSMDEVPIPYAGGARSAAWGDVNGDQKPDLLLATPTGPKLLINEGAGKFSDGSAKLPVEDYYNMTAAAFIDADADGQRDVLIANGFLGLRLYRNNIGRKSDARPTMTNWWHIGPFSNSRGQGFETAYEPEREIELKKTYTGRGQSAVTWKEGSFADGRVNSLALFNPQHNVQSVVYLYREFNYPAAAEVPVSVGSGDTLDVWFNGERLVHENVTRAAAADQHVLNLKMKQGKNTLLLKVVQVQSEFGFYFGFKSNAPVIPRDFEDVSDQMKLGTLGVAGAMKGTQLLVADFNGDGRQDFIYTASAGVLALNTPQGFVHKQDWGVSLKPGRASAAMGDFDGDQKVDLFVPQTEGYAVYRGIGDGRFSEASRSVTAGGMVTSGSFVDFDRDGKLDLLVGVSKGPNAFLRNVGSGMLAEASAEIGLEDRVFNTRALAVLDINKDGVSDLAMNNEGQDAVVLVGNPSKKEKK